MGVGFDSLGPQCKLEPKWPQTDSNARLVVRGLLLEPKRPPTWHTLDHNIGDMGHKWSDEHT